MFSESTQKVTISKCHKLRLSASPTGIVRQAEEGLISTSSPAGPSRPLVDPSVPQYLFTVPFSFSAFIHNFKAICKSCQSRNLSNWILVPPFQPLGLVSSEIHLYTLRTDISCGHVAGKTRRSGRCSHSRTQSWIQTSWLRVHIPKWFVNQFNREFSANA